MERMKNRIQKYWKGTVFSVFYHIIKTKGWKNNDFRFYFIVSSYKNFNELRFRGYNAIAINTSGRENNWGIKKICVTRKGNDYAILINLYKRWLGCRIEYK